MRSARHRLGASWIRSGGAGLSTALAILAAACAPAAPPPAAPPVPSATQPEEEAPASLPPAPRAEEQALPSTTQVPARLAERAGVELFERASSSVVYITTLARRVDWFGRTVSEVPQGPAPASSGTRTDT